MSFISVAFHIVKFRTRTASFLNTFSLYTRAKHLGHSYLLPLVCFPLVTDPHTFLRPLTVTNTILPGFQRCQILKTPVVSVTVTLAAGRIDGADPGKDSGEQTGRSSFSLH